MSGIELGPMDASYVLWSLFTAQVVKNVQSMTAAGGGNPKRTPYETLEMIGFRTGSVLMERTCLERPRFKHERDVIKFICKDFWNTVFKKQIDHLWARVNMKSAYVLQDKRFCPLLRMSAPPGTDASALDAMIADYLALPCGLIRGAITAAGFNCAVTAEFKDLPSCQFEVRIIVPSS